MLTACALVSCRKGVSNPNKDIALEDFTQLRDSRFSVNSQIIRSGIDSLIKRDHDSLSTDYKTRSYYLNRGDFLWIDRHGVDAKADSVLKWLETIDRDGFDKKKFRVDAIRRDLEFIRNIQVGSNSNNINAVMARIEYNLTKAYLKYATGQRFGYVNPYRLFNYNDLIDTKKKEGNHYRTLYDMKTDVPSKLFYSIAFRMIHNDSIGLFLREVQPHNPRYFALRDLLKPHMPARERKLILINMEQERWRTVEDPSMYKKFVLVNIPSYSLYAINGNDTLTMRIGCGSLKTKTPILSSRLKRMDINPKWYIPRSIIDKSISRHAGNVAYFRSHRFEVYSKTTGLPTPPSWEALHDENNYVVQLGGEGNALGRIIFRSDNKFAVYLHHTSTTGVFEQSDRSVSHGCVRVEKPFQLAAFLLGEGHEKDLHRIGYSMSADVSPLEKDKSELNGKEKSILDTLQMKLIVNSVIIEPQIPLFITYRTMLPLTKGCYLISEDVYGYNELIWNKLLQIIQV